MVESEIFMQGFCFGHVKLYFQSIVRDLEESDQWWGTSFTWVHWDFGSSLHNQWFPGLCFNKVLEQLSAKSALSVVLFIAQASNLYYNGFSIFHWCIFYDKFELDDTIM